MRITKRLWAVTLLAGCLASFTAGSHAATVSVSPGGIQAAIDSATDGDVLELQSGTYDEPVAFSKAVTVTKGAGQSPLYKLSTPTANGFAITFQANGIWDGVDIVFDCPYKSGVACWADKITGAVRNCSITDTANASSTDFPLDANGGAGLAGNSATLVIENCQVNLAQKYEAVLAGREGGDLVVKNSTIQGQMGNSWGMVTLHVSSSVTATDSTFKMTTGGNRGIVTVVSGIECTYSFDRCVIDASGVAVSQPASVDMVGNLAGFAASLQMTNTAVLYKTNGGATAGIRIGGIRDKASFQNCTFVDLGLGAGASVVSTNGGAVPDLTVQNCIFNTGATAPGAYVDSASAVTKLTVGANLASAAVPSGDLLAQGTVVVGDPKLAVDHIHLGNAESPANGAGLDLGLTKDLDGEARPQPVGTAPDLGCDENQFVPVELSAFSAE